MIVITIIVDIAVFTHSYGDSNEGIDVMIIIAAVFQQLLRRKQGNLSK